jgi:hypothetical protein
MTHRNLQPNAEATEFFELLENHRAEVQRVLEDAAESPWQLKSFENSITGLADAETELATVIGRRLLQSVSLDKLQQLLVHFGAFGRAGNQASEPTEAPRSTEPSGAYPSPANRSPAEAEANEPLECSDSNLSETSEPFESGASNDPEADTDTLSPFRTIRRAEPKSSNGERDGESEKLAASTDEERCSDAEHATSDPAHQAPSQRKIEEFKAKFPGKRGASRYEPDTVDQVQRHSDILEESLNLYQTTPKSRDPIQQCRSEKEKLRALFESGILTSLASLPKDLNYRGTAWLLCRMKALQELVEHIPYLDRCESEARQRFEELRKHSKVTQPGHIEAFRLDSIPKHGSWLKDALHWEEKLRSWLTAESSDEDGRPNRTDLIRRLVEQGRKDHPHEKTVRDIIESYCDAGFDLHHTRFMNALIAVSHLLDSDSNNGLDRRLLAAIEKYEEEQLLQQQQSNTADQLPVDWPGFELTRGKRVLMVGGTPRKRQERRLEETFECESFEWMEISKGNRNAECALEKLRNGTVDLIIVQLKFVAHAVSNPIFKERSAERMVVGAWSYGAGALSRAIATNVRDGQ